MLNRLKNFFRKKVDASTLEELEELFIQSDLGIQTSLALTEEIAKRPAAPLDEILQVVRNQLLASIKTAPLTKSAGPTVILVVGVNGSGKTTTVAKLARHLGPKTIVGAADTFRAAAIDQLETWCDRLSIPLVKHQQGADPSAVVYDTLTAAVARQMEWVLLDTAGRLHTKTDLMGELEKIRRVCEKVIPGSPHETFLVLDGTIGQNALDQARTFHQVTPISGIVLTKVDGTARGGIVIPIQQELGIPVKFLGTGEGAEDLQVFQCERFVEALLA